MENRCSQQKEVEESYRGNERRTWLVVGVAATVMVLELVIGYLSGSMALTADGWHMATHVGALTLAGLAYWYARRDTVRKRYTFGPSKIYALTGYTSAILLAVAALAMMAESVGRFFSPQTIDYLQALPVAVLGLIVNLLSAFILHGGGDDHSHGHHHGHHDGHDHHAHDHPGHEAKEGKPVDHNMRAAYLHVVADALTSMVAIVALLCGYFWGWWFMDPMMGIIGGVVILHWGINLCRQASAQLLDMLRSPVEARGIVERLESIDDCKVLDLHFWEIASDRNACILSISTSTPRPLDEYRQALQNVAPIHHLTIEIHP
jgi:cation diffusion facilitator family transporter